LLGWQVSTPALSSQKATQKNNTEKRNVNWGLSLTLRLIDLSLASKHQSICEPVAFQKAGFAGCLKPVPRGEHMLAKFGLKVCQSQWEKAEQLFPHRKQVPEAKVESLSTLPVSQAHSNELARYQC